MRPFEQLTARSQRRRLRSLALVACERYEPKVLRLSFVAESFNTIFRVDGGEGSAFALRVGARDQIHAQNTEATEAAWIAALRQDGMAGVPQVIATKDGSLVAHVRVSGVPGERPCVLFEWVPGQPMSQRMSLELVRQAGRLSALLHERGAAHASAEAPPVLIADRVLYFRNEPRLDELSGRYGALFTDAAERAQATVDRLWRYPPHPPHLLHGDLCPPNLIVADRNVVAIDFQDLIWGFDVQDVAITVAALQRYGAGNLLVEEFRSGYEEVRQWPASDPETLAALIAGRRLLQLNLGLNRRKPGLDQSIARLARLVGAWMNSAPIAH